MYSCAPEGTVTRPLVEGNGGAETPPPTGRGGVRVPAVVPVCAARGCVADDNAGRGVAGAGVTGKRVVAGDIPGRGGLVTAAPPNRGVMGVAGGRTTPAPIAEGRAGVFDEVFFTSSANRSYPRVTALTADCTD